MLSRLFNIFNKKKEIDHYLIELIKKNLTKLTNHLTEKYSNSNKDKIILNINKKFSQDNIQRSFIGSYVIDKGKSISSMR